MLPAVTGFGLRLDLPILTLPFGAAWAAVLSWLFLVASTTGAHPGPTWAGWGLFWLSPFWIAAAGGVSDPVLEYRCYSTVAGLGLLAAALLPAPALWGLVAIWFARSLWRSRCYRTRLAFWSQAMKENKGLGARVNQQYEIELFKAGGFEGEL